MDATTVKAHHREQCLDLIMQRFGEPTNISKLLDWIDAHMEGRSAQDVLLAFESEHHSTPQPSEPTDTEIIAYEDHAAHDAHPSEHPGCVHCNPPHTAECDTSDGFSGTYRISETDICHLLCSAWEGGSNYWAESNGTPYRFKSETPEGRGLGEDIAKLHLPVSVWDREDERKLHVLDADAIQLGVSRLAKYPRHLADVLSENADACTGDVFLQLCLFGEIVYG